MISQPPAHIMQLTEAIIGCAIEVHKTLWAVNSRLRPDLIIGGLVVAELKAIECVHPIHLSQVITYLKLADYPAGLLNFNVTSMRYGVHAWTTLIYTRQNAREQNRCFQLTLKNKQENRRVGEIFSSKKNLLAS